MNTNRLIEYLIVLMYAIVLVAWMVSFVPWTLVIASTVKMTSPPPAILMPTFPFTRSIFSDPPIPFHFYSPFFHFQPGSPAGMWRM